MITIPLQLLYRIFTNSAQVNITGGKAVLGAIRQGQTEVTLRGDAGQAAGDGFLVRLDELYLFSDKSQAFLPGQQEGRVWEAFPAMQGGRSAGRPADHSGQPVFLRQLQCRLRGTSPRQRAGRTRGQHSRRCRAQ